MAKRIFLHIGSPKTGSSSIQTVLFNDRRRLLKEGFLYPESLGQRNHKKILLFAKTESSWNKHYFSWLDHGTSVAELSEQFHEEIRSTKVENIIISSEHFLSTLTSIKSIKALHKVISDISNEIVLVLYIRRQDLSIVSNWSTQIRAGHVISLKHGGHWLYYYETIDLWMKIFENARLVLRKFERDSLKNGSVVDDFLDVTDINHISIQKTKDRKNQSLSKAMVAFYNVVYNQLNRKDRMQYFKETISNVEKISQSQKNEKIILSELNKRMILKKYQNSNRALHSSYDIMFEKVENLSPNEPIISKEVFESYVSVTASKFKPQFLDEDQQRNQIGLIS